MLLALKGFDFVVTTLNTTIEHSDKTTTGTLNTSINRGDNTTVTIAAESNEGTSSNTIVADTTENSSKILDTITYSTTCSTEKLPIVKQSITNLEAALFTTQQPDQSVFTKDSKHRSSIFIETPENEPTESSAETVSFRPLLSLSESGAKTPEISSLIATASSQPLSANNRQSEPYLVIILPLIGLSLAV